MASKHASNNVKKSAVKTLAPKDEAKVKAGHVYMTYTLKEAMISGY